MDTISIKIKSEAKFTDKEIKSIERHKFLKVTRAKMDSDNAIILKISYPKFMAESNAYLIMDSDIPYECNYKIYKILNKLRPYEELEIKILRVDIPFTYYMPEGMEFAGYKHIFYKMAQIFVKKNEKFLVKSISDFMEDKVETLTLANSTTLNNCNSKIVIYNQDKRFKDSHNYNYESILRKHSDLPNRIRIEVSKRIRRVSMTLEEFVNFDIFNEYKDDYLDFLFENLFDAKLSKNGKLKFGDLLTDIQTEEARVWFKLMDNISDNKLLIAKKYNYKFTLKGLWLAAKKIYSNTSSFGTASQRIKKYVEERHMEFYGCYIDSDKEFTQMAKILVTYYDFD